MELADKLKKVARRLRSERTTDRIKKDLAAYRAAVVEIGNAPSRITSSVMELGISEDLIDQAIKNLQEAKTISEETKGEMIAQAYHLAEAALSLDSTTQDIANALTPLLNERAFLELHVPTMVAILQATTSETFKQAKEALQGADPEQYQALFGDG